jgi:acrylyl-CoA reductase (NADPH)
MTSSFQAFVADKDNEGNFSATVKTLTLDDLPDNDTLVKIDFSTVNYKDGLAVTNSAPICASFPMVCGIDLAGQVVESSSELWNAGDPVLVNGYGLSERHWGAYSQMQRVNSEFLVRIPEELGGEMTMAIGTAGYTSMLAVNAIRDHGIKPDDGPILVTGSAGGVGSIAIMLLAKLGYEVTASTGRPETAEYLKSLGASATINREDLARKSKPLEKELYAGCVDSVGSTTLATALAQLKYGGIIAACGLAGGADLPSTVLPFLLRNVTLRGIDSVMAPMSARERAWNDLANLIDTAALRSVYSVRPLADVPTLGKEILEGAIKGRVVIDVNA